VPPSLPPVSQVIDPMEAEPLDAIVVDDGPSKVTLVATWIVVGLLVFLALWWTWNHVINPNGGSVVDRYVAGDGGHLYESLRDEFRVELPTTPQRRESKDQVVVVDSRPGPDYLFAVIREPEPDTALENYVPTLNTAAGALADDVGGEIVSQSDPIPIPINGVVIKDVVFRKGEHYYRNRLILANGRLYTLQVMVKGKSEKEFTAMAKTFKVLGPR
jgi:hypothetical protein